MISRLSLGALGFAQDVIVAARHRAAADEYLFQRGDEPVERQARFGCGACRISASYPRTKRKEEKGRRSMRGVAPSISSATNAPVTGPMVRPRWPWPRCQQGVGRAEGAAPMTGSESGIEGESPAIPPARRPAAGGARGVFPAPGPAVAEVRPGLQAGEFDAMRDAQVTVLGRHDDGFFRPEYGRPARVPDIGGQGDVIAALGVQGQ